RPAAAMQGRLRIGRRRPSVRRLVPMAVSHDGQGTWDTPVVTPDHYFSPEPSTAPRTHTVEFSVGGRDLALTASAGVFSGQRLDPGTAVLLRKAPLPGPRGGTYLDLGCGYGPIAMVLARTSDRATVYAVDVNIRALDLVAVNAKALGVAERVHIE